MTEEEKLRNTVGRLDKEIYFRYCQMARYYPSILKCSLIRSKELL